MLNRVECKQMNFARPSTYSNIETISTWVFRTDGQEPSFPGQHRGPKMGQFSMTKRWVSGPILIPKNAVNSALGQSLEFRIVE